MVFFLAVERYLQYLQLLLDFDLMMHVILPLLLLLLHSNLAWCPVCTDRLKNPRHEQQTRPP